MAPAETDHKDSKSTLMENKAQPIDLFEAQETVSVETVSIDQSFYESQDFPEIDFNISIPVSGSYDLSFGPIYSYEPPKQQEMFRHYIMSHWLHSSLLYDEDQNHQCEAIVQDHEHLVEAQTNGKLEISLPDEDTVEYWYNGSEEDFFMWKLRWSEFFDQKKT